MLAEVRRDEIIVDGDRLSYLHAGDAGPVVLLLHGTFWSRVWQPVLSRIGDSCRAIALDLPGFGLSGGELTVERAGVPELAELVRRATAKLGLDTFEVVGHDIGGAIVQYLAVHEPDRVAALALVNGVVLDSWPVLAVERFRDPEVRAATTAKDLLTARRAALEQAVERRLSYAEVDHYLLPWLAERRCRSWMAMAAAADAHYTLELVDGLKERARMEAMPTLLLWGMDDGFQRVEYAERYARELPETNLLQLPGRHIPQEDSPRAGGRRARGIFRLPRSLNPVRPGRAVTPHGRETAR